MSTEGTSEGELSELVPDHIFCDKNWDMLFPIMDTKSMTDELWSDSTRSRPGLDDIFSTRSIQCFNFLYDTGVDVWSFFKRASHNLICKVCKAEGL
jgi:hypothetical protein